MLIQTAIFPDIKEAEIEEVAEIDEIEAIEDIPVTAEPEEKPVEDKPEKATARKLTRKSK